MMAKERGGKNLFKIRSEGIKIFATKEPDALEKLFCNEV